MKAAVSKWLVTAACTITLLGVACSTNFQTGTGTTGDTSADGGFSDAPVSPGGIVGDNDNNGDGDPTVDPGTDVSTGEETRSFFTAFQIDPEAEDTAGPKFVVAGDVNQDGYMDLVSAWNQSQPVQLHLQERDENGAISFRTITIAGTSPVAIIAGLELGQINDDGWLDIVVLVKASGATGLCPKSPPQEISVLEGQIVVYFSPGSAETLTDGDNWSQMILVNPYVRDRWIHNQFPGNEWLELEELKTLPENGGFTALAVGNLDGVPGDEIVVALNPGECDELGQDPPINTIDVWMNPGPGLAETSEAWGVPPDINLSRNVPLSVLADVPTVTDVELSDIDNDGDLDIVAAWDNSLSMNVRWARNPLIPDGFPAVIAGASDGGPATCVGGPHDEGLCPNGNDDCLGADDGMCQAGTCVGGANPGSDCIDNTGCIGSEDGTCVAGSWRFYPTFWETRPVGQVDTNANVITMGDIDSDGFDDIVVRSTPGKIVQWFRKPNPVFDIEPEFPPGTVVPDRYNFPWPVFTLTEFIDRDPEAIAVGEVTGDGQLEVMVAVEGGVYWYDATVGASVFDPWVGNTIIQDAPADSGGTAGGFQGGVGVGVGATDLTTVINSLLVVDLDGDGRNDVVGTLDRRSGSGLSDDRLVWYRNIKTDDP